MGLLDFKVYVAFALRPEPDCSAQWQRIPAVPFRRVSLRCPAAKYPSRAQPPSIPAVPNLSNPSIPACLSTKYPCSAQPQSIFAVPNRGVSLRCKTAEHACSGQQQLPIILVAPNSRVYVHGPWQRIPAVPTCTVSLQCSMAKSPRGAQPLRCRTPLHLPSQCQSAISSPCICSAARKTF